MSAKKIKVLITGAGAPGAAGIIHCLRQQPNVHITAVDANPDAVGRHLADDFECIPFAQEQNFIEKLLSVCKAKSIDLLLPLVTKELIQLAQHKDAFKQLGCVVIISPENSLRIANDKALLYKHLQEKGIAVPQFMQAETIEEFQTAVSKLNYPKSSICFKPAIANGSRGFRVLNNGQNEFQLLFNEKPGNSVITLDDAIRIFSLQQIPKLLLSEFLPGDEYSIDCLANHGQAKLLLPRLRKKMIQGITVQGEFVFNKSIIDYCSKIIHELKLHGNIGIQVKESTRGEFLILEINPRVQGTISAALGAGINLPLLAIQQEMGEKIETEMSTVKWGTKFIRHWTEVFYE